MTEHHHGDGETLHDAEELLGLVIDANADYRRGKAAAIEAAIRGGYHLLTAKEQLPHRDFLPFLERAGLEPRTAQRWMSLARTGWKCDTVAHLGGIVKALKMHKWITDEGSLQATDAWAMELHDIRRIHRAITDEEFEALVNEDTLEPMTRQQLAEFAQAQAR